LIGDQENRRDDQRIVGGLSTEQKPLAAAMLNGAPGVRRIKHQGCFVLLSYGEGNPPFKRLARFQILAQFRFRRYDRGGFIVFAALVIRRELVRS